MNIRLWLRLGRVANLPTVWSNGLAGWMLSGEAPLAGGLLLLLGALSLFYVGGMFLNDAFDAPVDARERAERPIPRGDVPRRTVFAAGWGMLGLACLLAFLQSVPAGLCGMLLAMTIVLYDAVHKRTAWAPVIMGCCRLLSYGMAALGGQGLTGPVLLGAFGLFCHTVGLTYAARQEAYNRIGTAWPLAVLAVPVLVLAFTAGGGWGIWILVAYVAWGGWSLSLFFRRRPGDVPRGVVSLIAAIALYDAGMVVAAGHAAWAVPALMAFLLTLALQRLAPGT